MLLVVLGCVLFIMTSACSLLIDDANDTEPPDNDEPVLFEGFEDDTYGWGRWPTWGAGAISVDFTTEWKTQGEQSGKFVYNTDNPNTIANFSTTQDDPIDFSGYSSISFDINNPNDRQITLIIKIEDSDLNEYIFVENGNRVDLVIENGISNTTLPLTPGVRDGQDFVPVADKDGVLSDIQHIIFCIIDEGSTDGDIMVDNILLHQ